MKNKFQRVHQAQSHLNELNYLWRRFEYQIRQKDLLPLATTDEALDILMPKLYKHHTKARAFFTLFIVELNSILKKMNTLVNIISESEVVTFISMK